MLSCCSSRSLISLRSLSALLQETVTLFFIDIIIFIFIFIFIIITITIEINMNVIVCFILRCAGADECLVGLLFLYLFLFLIRRGIISFSFPFRVSHFFHTLSNGNMSMLIGIEFRLRRFHLRLLLSFERSTKFHKHNNIKQLHYNSVL